MSGSGAIEKCKTLGVLIDIRPHLHLYGHEYWVMAERVRPQMQAYEMRFLQKIGGVTMFDQLHILAIRESLDIESLPLRIERSQLRNGFPGKLYMFK